MTATASETPATSPASDISLIDLWLVLVERRQIIFIVFALFLIAGLAVSLLRAEKYTYFTSIEIGRKAFETGDEFIESASTVVAKIGESYLPAAIADYKQKNPEDSHRYDLVARIPVGSDLIVIEGVGAIGKQSAYFSILSAAVDALEGDHNRITDFQRMLQDVKVNRAQLAVKEAQNKLDELDALARLVTSDLKRIDESERLASKQLGELGQQIADSLSYRRQALAQVSDQPQAMTVLLIDSELENNRTRQAEVEKRLYIELKSERERLEKALADNRRERNLQLAEINAREQEVHLSELEKLGVTGTRTILPPARSLLPRGPGKVLILALATVAGIAAGLLAALLVAFIYRAEAVRKLGLANHAIETD